jgi:large subunit ribosomal protein L4
MRQGAFRSTLSNKLQDNNLIIIDTFETVEGKTRFWREAMDRFPNKPSPRLIVDTEYREKVGQSIRNFGEDKYVSVNELTIYDLVRFPTLFITNQAIDLITERLRVIKRIHAKASV